MRSMRGSGFLSASAALIVPLLPHAAPAESVVPRGDPAGLNQRSLPVRGLVRPVDQAAIASDLGVRVKAIRFRDAERFRKGDVLVEFDCERLEAEHAAADAVWREMKLALDGNVYLDKRGAVGKIDVEVSRARVDKAGSEARALQARLKQCAVIAPYDGRVSELTVNVHEIPAPAKPFISIVGDNRFEIDLIVPSAWLRHLEPGIPFLFTVDETGRAYDARVLRTGAAVDAVSQTVKVIAAFAAADSHIVAGMSGAAEFGNRAPVSP